MSTPAPAQGPTPIPIATWAAYNERVRQIRDRFYLDQQDLRKQRDANIKGAQDWYAVEIAKRQAKYETDVAAARAAFKPLG